MVKKFGLFCGIIFLLCTGVFTSCNKNEEVFDTPQVTNQVNEVKEPQANELRAAAKDEGPYLADLPNYEHYYFSDGSRCGPASYSVVRKALNTSFELSDKVIRAFPGNIKLDALEDQASRDRILSQRIPRKGHQTEVTLGRRGEIKPDVSKSENKKRRDRFSSFVKSHLIKGHPLLIPATYLFKMKPRNRNNKVFGHYYIVIGWVKRDNIVYYIYKDVMDENGYEKELDEESFLDAVWYNNVKIPNRNKDDDNYTAKSYTHSSYEALALWI